MFGIKVTVPELVAMQKTYDKAKEEGWHGRGEGSKKGVASSGQKQTGQFGALTGQYLWRTCQSLF